MPNPLLSICIPTYNRAIYLRDCLAVLIPQLKEAKAEIELIISDNDSTDATREVVADAAREFPLSYSKNAQNVGACKNIARVVEDLAGGEYCWMIGDDDLVRPGGVRAILAAIQANPDLDYFFVNYAIHDASEKAAHVASGRFSQGLYLGNRTPETGRIADWSRLIGEDEYALVALWAHVFRRQKWIEHTISEKIRDHYANVEGTYPQTLILAQFLVGQEVYRIAQPWVSVYHGQASWLKYEPLIVLKRFPELLDRLAAAGVSERELSRHRRRIRSISGEPVLELLLGRSLEGLNRGDALSFGARHFFRGAFVRSLLRAIGKKLRSSLRLPSR